MTVRLPSVRCALCAALSFALAGASLAQDAPAAAPALTAVKAAHWIDAESGRVRGPVVVIVRGERIAEVRDGGAAPAGARLIDLGDATLLPGLIDVHVHLTSDPTTGTGLVAGIIGGPDQGGTTEGTSYSPTFDDSVLDLARRAMAGS